MLGKQLQKQTMLSFCNEDVTACMVVDASIIGVGICQLFLLIIIPSTKANAFYVSVHRGILTYHA